MKVLKSMSAVVVLVGMMSICFQCKNAFAEEQDGENEQAIRDAMILNGIIDRIADRIVNPPERPQGQQMRLKQEPLRQMHEYTFAMSYTGEGSPNAYLECGKDEKHLDRKIDIKTLDELVHFDSEERQMTCALISGGDLIYMYHDVQPNSDVALYLEGPERNSDPEPEVTIYK